MIRERGRIMFVCVNCGYIFAEPDCWEETHGFNYGPFEEVSGCPECGEPYVEAYVCEGCNDYIDGPYIKTVDGARYCENCYTLMELGDED